MSVVADRRIEGDATDAESALCVACGLCCDGTLFGSIKLEAADLPLAAASDGGVVERNGRPAATQPCGYLDGAVCTVYHGRYHACRRFRCDLLDARAAGRIDRDGALGHIATARRLRGIVAQAADRAGVAGAMPAIRRAMRAWRHDRVLPLDPAMAALDLQLIALERLLARHFTGGRPLSQPAAPPPDASPLPADAIAAKAD